MMEPLGRPALASAPRVPSSWEGGGTASTNADTESPEGQSGGAEVGLCCVGVRGAVLLPFWCSEDVADGGCAAGNRESSRGEASRGGWPVPAVPLSQE